jgi:hypothetical protein
MNPLCVNAVVTAQAIEERQEGGFNATFSSSRRTIRRCLLCRAARAIATASARSVLLPCPVETRTRVASFAGTSITVSPAATSSWATLRPIPLAPQQPTPW